MLTNLHEGNEAWLASLRSNIITIFELADHGRDQGYIDMDPMDFFSDSVSISDVRQRLGDEGIRTGYDLNAKLREWEADGWDEDMIEAELCYIVYPDEDFEVEWED